MNPLRDKVALITGGTRGIGRAIAKMLLMEGVSVAICARSDPAQVVRELEHETGGKVKGKAADVSNDEQVVELFRFVDREFARLDILINNAGIGVFRPVAELSMDEWKRTIETNLSGAFYCSREALFRFARKSEESGTEGGGFIVNISSMAGKSAFAGGAAYNASKFGVVGFSEAMMQDVRSQGVRVSTIMPGSVATGFGGSAEDGADWKIWPQDVAEMVKVLLQMPERTLVSCVEMRPTATKSGLQRTR